jgi:pimeloyl-ACP methyl ester carboxylesterase
MGRAPDTAQATRPSASDGTLREQYRARYPDRTGFAERNGVRTFYEVYGDGEPAIVFVPAWSLVHSRAWKAQIPDFARRHRVIAYDPRGNGGSDRPVLADAYAEHEMAGDLLAVMDATETEQAVIVSFSLGAQRVLIAAAQQPERFSGLVFIGPAVPLGERMPERDAPFDARLASNDGWAKYNRHFWRTDYEAFLEFFLSQCYSEPHSTKQIEDGIGWGREIAPETLILTHDASGLDATATRALSAMIRCPTMVIQGDGDAVTGPATGPALAEAIPGTRLVTLAGAGHIPNARDPVQVNLLIRDFVAGLEVAT